MLRSKLVLLVVLSGWISSFSLAADKDMTAKIDAVFKDFQSDDAPGVAVLVIQNGKSIFERGYGVSDLRTKHRITPDTNFRLASLSKEFTAMAVMLLVHDHKISYSDHVTDVFPDFPEYGKAITIRQLLTHTSGLLDYEDLMANSDGLSVFGKLGKNIIQPVAVGKLVVMHEQHDRHRREFLRQ